MPSTESHNNLKKIDEGLDVAKHSVDDRLGKMANPATRRGADKKSNLEVDVKDPTKAKMVAGHTPSTSNMRDNKCGKETARRRRDHRKRRRNAVGVKHENKFEAATNIILSWSRLPTEVIVERANKLNNLRPIIAVLDKFIEESGIDVSKFVTMRDILRCVYEDRGDVSEFVSTINDSNGRSVAEKMALEEARLFAQYYPESTIWVECRFDANSNIAKYSAKSHMNDSVFNKSLNEGCVIKKIHS